MQICLLCNESLFFLICVQLCNGNILEEAKQFATKVIGQPLDSRRLSRLDVKDAANVDLLFEGRCVTMVHRCTMKPIFVEIRHKIFYFFFYVS